MEIIGLVTSLFGLLPELAVFILCAFYYSRTKSTAGLLMALGSGGGLLLGVFYRAMPVLSMEVYAELSNQSLFFITGIIGFIMSTFFVVGLGMLLLKEIHSK